MSVVEPAKMNIQVENFTNNRNIYALVLFLDEVADFVKLVVEATF